MKQAITKKQNNQIFCIVRYSFDYINAIIYLIEYGLKYVGAVANDLNTGAFFALTPDAEVVMLLSPASDPKKWGILPTTIQFRDTLLSDKEVREHFNTHEGDLEKLNKATIINDNGMKIFLSNPSMVYLRQKISIARNKKFLLQEPIDREKSIDEFSHEEFLVILSRVSKQVKSVEHSKKIYEKKLGLPYLRSGVSEGQIFADFLLHKKHNIVLTLRQNLKVENSIRRDNSDLLLTFEPLYKRYYSSVFNKLSEFPYGVHEGTNGDSLIMQDADGFEYEVINPYPGLPNIDNRSGLYIA